MYAIFLKYSENVYIIYDNLNSTKNFRFIFDTNLKSILKFLKPIKLLTFETHLMISKHLLIYASAALGLKFKCILIPTISIF